MKLLRLISNAFINTMGITQPSPKAANRAAWIIFLMLAAVLTGLIAVVMFGLHFASSH